MSEMNEQHSLVHRGIRGAKLREPLHSSMRERGATRDSRAASAPLPVCCVPPAVFFGKLYTKNSLSIRRTHCKHDMSLTPPPYPGPAGGAPAQGFRHLFTVSDGSRSLFHSCPQQSCRAGRRGKTFQVLPRLVLWGCMRQFFE